MSSPVSPLSDIDPTAVTTRPSYEAFLRIKQGIGSEALRAAGLPPVEALSYDAYVAAINRKAAEKRMTEQPAATAPAEIAPVATRASRVSEAKRLAWTSIVVVPVALVAVILVISMFKGPSDGALSPNASEALASTLTSDGVPVALSLTAIEDMPPLALPADDAATHEPVARFDTEMGNDVAAVEPSAEKVELLPIAKPAQASAAQKKKSAAASAPSQAAVMPVQERRVAAQPEKKVAAPARKAAKKNDDFWQPLVDLLDGKGLQGARNVPPPEDRIGR